MATDAQKAEIYHLLSDFDGREWVDSETIDFWMQFIATDDQYDLIALVTELFRYADLDFALRDDENNGFGFHAEQFLLEWRPNQEQFQRMVDGSDVPAIPIMTINQKREVRYIIGKSFYDGLMTDSILNQHMALMRNGDWYDLTDYCQTLLRLIGRYHMANRPFEWQKAMRRAESLRRTGGYGNRQRRVDGSDTPTYAGVT